MRKKIAIIISLIVILTSGVYYINNQYFFNPVSFDQDFVTPHNWNDYKRPLELTIYSFEQGEETETIKQEQEIRGLLEDLKESPSASETEFGAGEVNGGLTLTADDRTLLEVLFYPDHWEILKRNTPTFELTDSLKQFIDRI
ncbi:hypothetical protein [Halobacillus seohaensis]|uniref:GerMN domain-containing protein n=1 Tax=Halobacillus seohaensis TaxID=447421 RepID=A0ABW2ELQ0_9BACI